MEIVFSSWNGKVIDNRGKPREEWQRAAGLKLPKEFDSEHRIAAFMGWDGFIIREEPSHIVSLCHGYMRAVQKESCGKCFPCRIGTAVLLNHLDRLMNGEGTGEDIDALETLGKEISKTSKCSIGKTGPIPILHAVKHFRHDFESAVKRSKPIPDNVRYESRWTAPCHAACPAGMDIPGYVEKIREGDFCGSLKTVFDSSPMASSLGRSCFHPCENSCRRENVDRAVAICKLKRFAWDYEDQHVIDEMKNPNKHAREEKVAVIGAGPAGVSAAYYLALYGYRVTLFESLPVPGGMVGVGIPPYRVPKDILARESELVKGLGVEIRYNTRVGKDITILQMKEQGYKALFIASGAHLSKKMGVEGEDKNYDGFLRGVEFLRQFILTGEHKIKGKRVLVVGGGNVAMDCARSPIRLGASKVTIVYRRTRKELPADPHEVHEADDEGVQFELLVAPKRITHKKGKVTGLECIKMELGPPDDSGRRRPIPIEGTEHVIPGDIVIQAIGQDCDLSLLDGVDGLKFTRWQTIEADPDTMQTDIEWIFTGGDVYNGPLSVVDSCGNAKRAATSIHQYLQGGKPSLSTDEKMGKVMRKLGVYDKKEKVGIKGGWDRLPMPNIAGRDKTGTFKEVEKGYTRDMAVEEASRCMRCYQVGMVALEKISN